MNYWTGGEPTLDDVRREFPGWECRREVSGRCSAWRGDVIVDGEDPVDLRDEIMRAQSREDAASH